MHEYLQQEFKLTFNSFFYLRLHKKINDMSEILEKHTQEKYTMREYFKPMLI